MVMSEIAPTAGSAIGGTSSSVVTLDVVPVMVRLAASMETSTLETSNGFSCCRTRTHALRWLTWAPQVRNRTRVMSLGSGSTCRNRNCIFGGQSWALLHQWGEPGRS
jgi:hypothetical protein